MILFIFEFTKISCETINARTFRDLLTFQYTVILIKWAVIDNLYETGLNTSFAYNRTRTAIITGICVAYITGSPDTIENTTVDI